LIIDCLSQPQRLKGPHLLIILSKIEQIIITNFCIIKTSSSEFKWFLWLSNLPKWGLNVTNIWQLKHFKFKIFVTFNPHFGKFESHKNHLNSDELVFIMQKLVIIICSIFDKIINKCGPFNRWGWDKQSIIKHYMKKCDLTVKYVFVVNFEIVWNDTYLLLIRPFLSYLRRKLTFIAYIAISKPHMKTKNLPHLYFKF
jgi:hypothetical protein